MSVSVCLPCLLETPGLSLIAEMDFRWNDCYISHDSDHASGNLHTERETQSARGLHDFASHQCSRD